MSIIRHATSGSVRGKGTGSGGGHFVSGAKISARCVGCPPVPASAPPSAAPLRWANRVLPDVGVPLSSSQECVVLPTRRKKRRGQGERLGILSLSHTTPHFVLDIRCLKPGIIIWPSYGFRKPPTLMHRFLSLDWGAHFSGAAPGPRNKAKKGNKRASHGSIDAGRFGRKSRAEFHPFQLP